MARLLLPFVLIAFPTAVLTAVRAPSGHTTSAGGRHAARANEPARVASASRHVLRITMAEDIATLDPVLTSQNVVNALSQLTMGWLFRFDAGNRPVPELALEIPTKRNRGISADGRAITLHMRRGVKWSDGVAFDADDVAFSIAVMNNPANNVVGRDGFDRITHVDEPDKFTIVIHLRRPYAAFIPTFFGSSGANPCVLPKHILASLPNINQAAYNTLPIGIGPFRYTAWRHGDAVEMEANPLYWRGRPKLQKIVYKIIPDRNTALTQMQTGELDMWLYAPGAYVSRLQTTPGVEILRHPSFIYNHIDFNLSNVALADVNVRRALRLGMDRPTILAKVRHGVGTLSESFVPSSYPNAPHVPLVPFNVSAANALLDRAGWRRGADGIRSKDGRRLSLTFATATGTPDTDVEIEIIRSGWQKLGVELSVQRYSSPLLFATQADGGIIYGGKFDVVAFGTGSSIPDDAYSLYGCSEVPPAGQNDSHYCNRRLDRLMLHFQAAYDERSQDADLAEEVKITADDAPFIVESQRDDVFAYRHGLSGYAPNEASVLDDMMNVDN